MNECAPDMNEKVLFLDWKDASNDEEDFTPVVSRKQKKKLRTGSVVRERKLKAAAVKVHNYHPMSGIVTGTRERKYVL